MDLWLIITIVVVGACLLCCTVPCMIGCCQSRSFVNQVKREAEGASQIIKTKKGEIEVNTKGKAPYVLCLHGAPGIHDGYANIFDDLVEAGLGVIAPSRPGYGRSPVESGPTPPEAADLMAALLDEMQVDSVVVYGISGGGATALNFALRHPNRCKGCVTEVGCTGGWVHPMKADLLGAGHKFQVTSPLMAVVGRKLLKSNPAKVVETMMYTSLHDPEEKKQLIQEIASDPKNVDMLLKAMKLQGGASCYPNTWNGFQADIRGMEMVIDFKSITVPVLIVAGTHDGDVPIEQGQQAADGIPGSEFLAVEKGWHLLCFHKDWPQI